ncbi:hypothetical protein MLD38_005506 [Melastoma candidum]|uniref:Uncharacterized protein n=1 Tax=Melastoma candidum TaxID=119954 RepID=A0ACB9RMX7_9MYRT|nr:hypothetical protein MLD38_005506 [Melastoma candidum]
MAAAAAAAAVSPSPSVSPVDPVLPPKGDASAVAAGPSASTAPPPTTMPLRAASPPDSTASHPPPPLPAVQSPPPAAAVSPRSSPSPAAISSPPPAAASSSHPVASRPPPTAVSSPLPAPLASSPPPVKSTSPPPSISPPTTPSPSPPSPNPPPSSPPPPSVKPPVASPPPPATKPPNSVSPSPPPPGTAPPPPPVSSNPPQSSPPPPSPPVSNSPIHTPPSPPPQVPISPQASPPPPPSEPTKYSPPPSSSNPLANSPPVVSAPPPVLTPSLPASRPVGPTPPILSPLTPTTPANPPGSSSDPNSSLVANSTGQTESGISTGAVVVIGVAASIFLLSIIGFSAWCIKKHRKKVTGLPGDYIVPMPTGSPPGSAPQAGSSSRGGVGFSPRAPGAIGHSGPWFMYEELVRATDGFAYENLLGEGGFGSVYKGCLPDGKEIAVKQLKIGSGQGDREFKAEVEIISRIHHRHLVTLVGYCISDNQRLLVYDFVPNNTLYFHLHGKNRPTLDWATRMKIAAGAARGVAYLHEGCHPRIIHRDIKSSNILLDNNFEARVSDFGLAKLAADANTHITTRVMGTFGYMAPEYASTGKLTEKSDVFSFGVVLLELITGRKPVDQSQPLGDESLVEWARPLLNHALEKGAFEGLLDPRLEGNFVKDELLRLIEAAAACIRHSAAKRPSMGQVVRALDTLTKEDLTNGMRLGDSEVYNSAQQNEEIRLFRRMAFGIPEYSTEVYSQSSSNV